MNLCKNCGVRIQKLGDLWHHITERIAHHQIQFIIHGRVKSPPPRTPCPKGAEPVDFTV